MIECTVTAAGVLLIILVFKNDVDLMNTLVLKSDRNSILACYDPNIESVVKVKKKKHLELSQENAEQTL